MERQLIEIKSGEIGIKHIIHEKRLFPKTFEECGRFSFSTRSKKYVKGQGIVLWIVEYTVVYFCRHQAFPFNLGNECRSGHIVCQECSVMCEICGQYLCLVPGCCNPIIIEDRISCNEHLEQPKFLGIF